MTWRKALRSWIALLAGLTALVIPAKLLGYTDKPWILLLSYLWFPPLLLGGIYIGIDLYRVLKKSIPQCSTCKGSHNYPSSMPCLRCKYNPTAHMMFKNPVLLQDYYQYNPESDT